MRGFWHREGVPTAWGIPASKRVWIFIEFISYSSPSSVDLNVTMYLVSAAVQTLRNTWIAYCWINTTIVWQTNINCLLWNRCERPALFSGKKTVFWRNRNFQCDGGTKTYNPPKPGLFYRTFPHPRTNSLIYTFTFFPHRTKIN